MIHCRRHHRIILASRLPQHIHIVQHQLWLQKIHLSRTREHIQQQAWPVGCGIGQWPREPASPIHLPHRLLPPPLLHPEHLLGHTQRRHCLLHVRLLLHGAVGRLPLTNAEGRVVATRRGGRGEDGPRPQRRDWVTAAATTAAAGGWSREACQRGVEAVGAGERGEHVLGPDGAAEHGVAREALERGLEAEAEVGERRRRALGGGEEERPRRVGAGAEEVDEGGGVRGLRPLREEAAEEEGGLADAAGPVEDERLRDARAERVVVEDRLEDGARDHTPRPAAAGRSGGRGGHGRRRRREVGRVLWGVAG
ncbi:Os09g0296450, partial [Oryza sativa Japonica Group]